MTFMPIKLEGSLTRKFSTAIILGDGENITLALEKDITKVAPITVVGPATIVADLGSEIQKGMYRCTKIRQRIIGGGDVNFMNDSDQFDDNPRPANEGIRKVLRHIAVHGELENPNGKSIPVREYDGTLDPVFNCAWIHTPGGFCPFVDEDHIALECARPGLPNSKTSWIVLELNDARVIFDEDEDVD